MPDYETCYIEMYPDNQMSLKLLSYCQQSLKQSILKN